MKIEIHPHDPSDQISHRKTEVIWRKSLKNYFPFQKSLTHGHKTQLKTLNLYIFIHKKFFLFLYVIN